MQIHFTAVMHRFTLWKQIQTRIFWPSKQDNNCVQDYNHGNRGLCYSTDFFILFILFSDQEAV